MTRLIAILTAAVVTSLVALGMLAVGVSAMTNPNSVPVSDAPTNLTVATESTTTDPQALAQINQLKGLVAQYQGREKQYQAQVDQLNTQVQQLQNILNELQRRGIIRLQADGSIQLPRGRRDAN